MTFEKFSTLEQRLNRLLASLEELKAENGELRDALGRRDLEVKSLRERLRRLDEEKVLVKEKVDTLLVKLDGLTQGI